MRPSFPLLLALTIALACIACDDPESGPGDAIPIDTTSDATPLPDLVEGDTTTGPDTTTVPEDTADDTIMTPDAIDGGSIAIYVTGDSTEKTFTDGLSGQTPRDYVIALSRYEVLTSATDTAPVLCFDHGSTPVELDMSADTLAGVCPTTAIPSATYTHGRVKVDWARYTVDGTMHAAGQTLPGPFTLFRAYSDTTYEGASYAAGEGWVSFGGTETAFTYEPFPDLAGITTEVVGGEYLMTFPFNRDLPVVKDDPDTYWSRFHWEIFESFRWEELTTADYVDGTWDVATTPTETEPVLIGGVTGYHVTTSLD